MRPKLLRVCNIAGQRTGLDFVRVATMIECRICGPAVGVGVLLLGCAVPMGASVGDSQTKAPPAMNEAQSLVHDVIENENAAAARQDHWEYLSNERSGRTGGHLWTERVVETTPGRVRLLIAVDGTPLTPEQMQAERARVEQIRLHPDVFILHEKGTRAEERRARELMDVLPKDFLFEDVQLAGGVWRMNFRPNPDYVPSGVEERVAAWHGGFAGDRRQAAAAAAHGLSCDEGDLDRVRVAGGHSQGDELCERPRQRRWQFGTRCTLRRRCGPRPYSSRRWT